MVKRCTFDFEVRPEIVDYDYDNFKEYVAEKCAPAFFASVQKAKSQLAVIDSGATRDASVDVDLSCKFDDNFVPDCDGTVTITVD